MLLRELKSIEKTGSGYVLHGDAAVSYTHLDVYKRQVTTTP